MSTRFLVARAAQSDSVISGADPTKFETSNPLRLFIIQAAIIIIVTRVLGFALQKIKQPRVIAEVIGGILLGPTAMGRIPGFTKHIFPPPSLPYLNLVSTLGLVLFLFLVGLEVDVRVIRRCAKESSAISIAGMVLPFGMGAAVSVGIYNTFIDSENVSFGHFVLFTGVAMAITAFPVLARILTETKLLYTKVGVIVLAAGVGNDVVGWILLALTVALVNADTGLTAIYILLCAIGWILILFLLIKPAFIWLARRTGSFENGPNQVMIMITLLLVLVSAWITDIIGVHPIFGSFLVGLMIPHEGGFTIALTEKMEDLVLVIFLPIYFALSGLKTNLGDLNSGKAWAYTVAIIVIAFFSKFIGCAAAARAFGFNLRESAAVGTLMSCKGLVELIVLNIGLSAGILDTKVFSMFVLMAVVSTVITTPLTLWIYPESCRTRLDDASIHSYHGGKESSGDEEEEYDTSSRLSPKRLLVVLSSFEHLPGLMTLVQLMQPTLAAANTGTANSTEEEGVRRRGSKQASSGSEGDVAEKSTEAGDETDASINGADEYQTPVLASEAPYASALAARSRAQISIDALRLVELTDRTSAVMKVSESEDTMRADPIINVFSTFAHLNGLPVQSTMSVIPQEAFAAAVTQRCKAAGSNFIILPMTLSQMSCNANHSDGDGIGQDANAAGPSSPLASTLANPLENLFGGGWSSNASEGLKGRYSTQHFNVVRKIIQTAETDVGLVIERKVTIGSGAAFPQDSILSGGIAQSMLVAFMGGPDDRAALDLVSRLCANNRNLRVVVVRMSRISSEEAGEEKLPTVPPAVHHEMSLNHSQQAALHSVGAGVYNSNADTAYPTQYASCGENKQTWLEAALQDGLALQRIQDQIAADRFGGRLRIKTISTARPLRELIMMSERNAPAIVVVGRGRRNPTQTHRDELKALMKTHHKDDEVERQLNSEMTKVIGEAATALTFAQARASTLVIAAGFTAGRRT
ncbi:related to KHA1 - Putative K+/H+ antiporter [Melanopsichium pennsylvanicum]|uniref:Related to KHA1 - Putative K+/H+ antiporter n=2 Tax=Melanopsichium pennsylvanicum TaxID=63383 RepID=A0AAJ5C8M2_9BASI|nr:related to KHA1-Putative K /H antiporter [Melanopsichium pennsylvanicum 4]SNX87644.1 related to KHA1 - Putative K+/H+ antiporter [Melanopsichium pennsylvanicum]